MKYDLAMLVHEFMSDKLETTLTMFIVNITTKTAFSEPSAWTSRQRNKYRTKAAAAVPLHTRKTTNAQTQNNTAKV